ncbi:hypothetical protein bcere0007_14920 [Bacillus mycoides]|uniref:Uncharacterized protein n=1 Tax=Bacillus mycoides TaxID=1405 RepID=C2PTW0_BACMY|nr:hypothetical protein bcere0007_14920 [Bacillus mycoides]VXC35833.1 conserved hypothetical protein [Bacillus mycoides]
MEYIWNSPSIQEKLMKTASAIFIMGTLQVNRDNMSIFIQQKNLTYKT